MLASPRDEAPPNGQLHANAEIALALLFRRREPWLLRRGLVAVVIGAAGGVAGAIATGEVVRSMIQGAGPVNSFVCAGAALLLAAAAATAIWPATRRLGKLDLVEVLRAE